MLNSFFALDHKPVWSGVGTDRRMNTGFRQAHMVEAHFVSVQNFLRQRVLQKNHEFEGRTVPCCRKMHCHGCQNSQIALGLDPLYEPYSTRSASDYFLEFDIDSLNALRQFSAVPGEFIPDTFSISTRYAESFRFFRMVQSPWLPPKSSCCKIRPLSPCCSRIYPPVGSL